MTEEQKKRDSVLFSRHYIDQMVEMAGENKTAHKLFNLFCKNMDGNNKICVSTQTIQELMNVSKQTISSAIKYLKNNGWIDVLKNGPADIYVVNSEICLTNFAVPENGNLTKVLTKEDLI